MAEHTVDGLILGPERRRFLAFVPLAPVVLHGQHVFNHGVVQRVVVRLAVGLHIAVEMIFLFVKAVARQFRQFFLFVQVFPLAAIFIRIHKAGQFALPDFQQLFRYASDVVGLGVEAAGQQILPRNRVPVAHRCPAHGIGPGLADPAEVVLKAPFKAVVILPAPQVCQGVVQ